ncbi:MAG: hypothetical protein ACE5NN_03295 [Candidatus Bathyarchaeia archaeon]
MAKHPVSDECRDCADKDVDCRLCAYNLCYICGKGGADVYVES